MERKPIKCVFSDSSCPPECNLGSFRKKMREKHDHPRGDLARILRGRTEVDSSRFFLRKEESVYKKHCLQENGKK